MTKNPFKLKIIDDLPFFGDITSFLNFKDSSFKRIAWALWQKALTISITFLSFVEIELLYRQDRFFKPLKKSVFDYRIRTRTLITTNCRKLNSIQFVIAFFPFIFTFSFCLRSRYKEQLFSYLVKDTLPGIGVSHQDLSWETFREIYSKKIISFPDKFLNISTQKYKYFVSKTEGQIEVVNLADSNRKILSNENEKEGASSMRLLAAHSASPSILPPNKGVDKNKGDVVFVNSSMDSAPLEFGTEGNEAYASGSIFSPSLLSSLSGKDTHQTSYGVESRKIPSLYEYLKQTGLLRTEHESCTFNNGSASTDRFASHAEEKYHEKDEKFRNQDFIERLDVSSNLILLEMKPAWEQKQKQFYIGFLPKKNQISLNKLPLFFDRKQKVGLLKSSILNSSMRSLACSNLRFEKHSKKEIVHISNVPLQIKNTKNNNKEKVYAHKFYARKQNFLRSYKDKIDLKTTLINKKPNLINVFSKQQFQQKLFDLDELPLKLDQNYSEVLFSKTQENQENLNSNILNPLSILPADRESLIIPTPNLFETLQTFPNPLFTSDLLRFSSNKERKIDKIENGIANQTKLLNILSEEKESGNVSEETESGDESKEKKSGNVSEETESGDESKEKESGDERLLLPNEPTQIEDQKPIFIKELLEHFDKDGEEETFYKKIFLENELKKVFYNEEFFGSNPLDPTYSFTNFKQTFSAQRAVWDFKVRTDEFDLFDSIQALILNLEKNHISLNLGLLPEQSGLISSRLLSGYSYPDMEITTLRSLRLQKFYKNLTFQKQDKEILSMKIELPSSFLTDPFESDESEPNQKKGNPILTVHSEGPCFSNLENPEVCLNLESEGFFPFAMRSQKAHTAGAASTNKSFDESGVQPKGFAQSSSGAKEQFASHEGFFVRARNIDAGQFYEDSLFRLGDDGDEGNKGDYFSMGDEGYETGEGYEVGEGYEADEGYETDEGYKAGEGYEADEGYELVIKRGEEGGKGYELFVSKNAQETHKIGNLLKVPQLKFHYLPTSQTLLNKSCLEKLNISGIYQKVPTIYKQEINLSSKPFALLPLSLWGDISSFVRISLGRDVRPIIKNSVFESPSRGVLTLLKPLLYSQKPFRDYWEPVTLQSWLVITKLSFAFLTLKFFQNFILNEGKFLLRFLSEKLKEELGLTDNKKDKGYRLIKKVQKRFKDVAGIDNILPELGEMVWVLRNSGRSFKVGRVLPKGFLFVGPPGTGKTLLVQAIAGEAEVPVLVQSGSSLTDAGENEKGAQRLKKLFEQARKVAPCIVFIDEIDTLGESRQNVMSNNVGADDLIQSLHQSNQGLTEKSSSDFVTKSKDKAGNLTEKKSRGGFSLNEDLQHNSYLSITKKNQAKQEANQEQLNLLMQFLVELDGLKSRAGIIVIGATNRPKVLDPALTRPGRFDRVLSLEFPGKTKRIEILKLYSQNIGIIYGETKKQISSTTEQAKPKESLSYISNTNHAFGDQDFAWEYLANRTFGFSAADLAAAMNLSSIQAILRNTGHTIETIEQGIESITTYSIKKPKIERTTEKDPFFITRFAYYQAGKAVLHTLLPQHPDAIVLKLWPQPKNSRHKNVNLQLTSWSLNHRAKLETRLIGLYAGKAAELVALSLNSQTKKQAKTTNTRKTTSTIKENKGPNRKTVSFLRTKNALRNRYVITSPKQNLTNQDLWKPKSSSFLKSSILTSLPYSNPAARGKYQEKQGLLKSSILKSGMLLKPSVLKSLACSMRSQAAHTARAANLRFEKHRIISDLLPSTIKTKQITLRPFAPLPAKNVVFVSRGIRLQAKSFDVSGEIEQKNQQVHSQYNKRNLWHSSLGIEDLSVASNLAHSLVEKWHFYSNKIAIRRENQIFTNQNIVEISETGVFELFQQLTEDVQNRISASNISESTDAKQSEGRDKHSRYNFQEWSIRPWWQNEITEQTGNLNMFYDDWYRIYLSDPEESERNDEWVAPEEYYHNTQNLKNLLPKYSYRKNSYLLPTFKNLTNPKIPGLSKPKSSLPYSNPAARGKYQEKQGLLKSSILKSGMLLKPSVLTSLKAHRGFISELNNNKRKIDQATAAKLNILKDLPKTSAFNSHVKDKNNRSKNKNKPFAFEGPRREFLFKNRQIKNKLNFDVTWNDLYKLDRDYIYHALILTCFNKAFSLLDENRELLDYLADYLMRFETLRQHKIKQIFYDFGYYSLPNESLIKKE